MRGAYFVQSTQEEKPTIDVFILDPNKKVIFSRRKKIEGIFRFNATIPGPYSFIFSNVKVITIKILPLHQSKKDKDVTIALHTEGNDEVKEDKIIQQE